MHSESSIAIVAMLAIMLSITTGCGEVKKQAPETIPVEEAVEEVSTSTEQASAGEASTGKELYATCVACHGENGQGMKSLNAPSLVNQEEWYLERQLHNFKAGIRGGDPEDVQGAQMAAMAKTLADEQAVKNVVAYIKTLPTAKTERSVEGDAQNGKDYYNMICGACHGAGAVGNLSLNSPALVGIDDWYLKEQIYKFKDGTRGGHPDDEFGEQMKLIAASIPKDELISDVVAYIQSLQAQDN